MNLTRYSISDLEKLTGIKAHTIRIWEKRYSIISPERTDTNIRFYDMKQLQKLLNISFLNRHGYKISHISEMTDAQMEGEVSRLCESTGSEDGYIPELIRAAGDLDEDRFEKTLNSVILKLGFEQAFRQVIFPLLDKISLLWQIGKINACQERFVSNLIRHKLVVAVDGMTGHNEASSRHYLLYLPFGHYNEINLLFANYLIRKAGHPVIYLGPSIPLEHLKSLSNRDQITHIAVCLNQGFTEKELAGYIDRLTDIFPNRPVMLIAVGLDYQVTLPGNVVRIHAYEDLNGKLIH